LAVSDEGVIKADGNKDGKGLSIIIALSELQLKIITEDNTKKNINFLPFFIFAFLFYFNDKMHSKELFLILSNY
jgi:hypothetical protein